MNIPLYIFWVQLFTFLKMHWAHLWLLEKCSLSDGNLNTPNIMEVSVYILQYSTLHISLCGIFDHAIYTRVRFTFHTFFFPDQNVGNVTARYDTWMKFQEVKMPMIARRPMRAKMKKSVVRNNKGLHNRRLSQGEWRGYRMKDTGLQRKPKSDLRPNAIALWSSSLFPSRKGSCEYDRMSWPGRCEHDLKIESILIQLQANLNPKEGDFRKALASNK